MSELRYHPFLDQWVITATHRQDRTFLPPDDYCPLCPTKPGGFPTEVPFESYDIVVFENKFPSLSPQPPKPEVEGTDLTPVRPSSGVCEVVCYSQVHDSTFAGLPYTQVRKLTRVWQERYVELGDRPDVEYVFIFENKGKEIGVTLSHPHGQIYAYPFIPPTLRIEVDSERRYYEKNGHPIMQAVLQQEGIVVGAGRDLVTPLATMPSVSTASGELTSAEAGYPETPSESHIVCENDRFVAFIPFFARYPYEVYVTTREHIRSLREMDGAYLDDLAEILLLVTRKYDKLFNFSMPYIMGMHQQPTVPGYDFNWFHVEFLPPYRTANKLKYLAGSEASAGAFINDTLPEVTSRTLREIEVEI